MDCDIDFRRIRSVIDCERLMTRTVTVFGGGAVICLILDLVRCGVRSIRVVDPDTVAPENLVRQGHERRHLGRLKVHAVRERILELRPDATVEAIPFDCTGLDDDASRQLFGGTHLFIAATDSFACQSYANRVSLMLNVPAVFPGVYAGGLGAEVVWTDPARQSPCWRCLCARRYDAQAEAASRGESADPPSDGADIFSVRFPDAITGQVAIGLLTRGADNRYGRLIDALGNRQFLQVSLSPEFSLNGRDTVQTALGVRADQPEYAAWCTAALADPDGGQLPCDDCRRYRGHRFIQDEGRWRRITAAQAPQRIGQSHEEEPSDDIAL